MPSRSRVRRQEPCGVCATWVCTQCGRKKFGRVKRERGLKHVCRNCGIITVGSFINVRHTTGGCA